MMSSVRKRKNLTTSSRGKSVTHSGKEDGPNGAEVSDSNPYPLWLGAASTVAGLAVMAYCGYYHSWLMYTFHENNLWFSNIKEVEREISFRTEAGLYYSYYKQVVHAPSLSQGIHDLMNDQLTEYPDTINILERMNVYQEVILAALYKILPAQLLGIPMFFYIKSVFALHGVLVASLFVMTWLLSHSWMAGALAALFYSFNRLDTTRVSYTIPLRESFALPFVWIQLAALTYYFRPSAHGWRKNLSVAVIGLATFVFCLFWQFNQFIMLLQAFALFGLWILDVLPETKIQTVFASQVGSLLGVCILQFCNKMILGSLVLSFIPATLLLMVYRGRSRQSSHWLQEGCKVVMYSVLALALMVVINTVIKLVLQVESDEHIFKFLQNKFSGEEVRDFDSLLYLCLAIFGFLTMDVYERLTKGFVLPFYAIAHLSLLVVLLVDVITQWRSYTSSVKVETTEKESDNENSTQTAKKEAPVKKSYLIMLKTRPELLFHTVQCVFFGALAMTTLRMKYLWTPYMCVFGAVIVGDPQLWNWILFLVKSNKRSMVTACRHASLAVVLAALVVTALPQISKDLEDLREFWDPDTVDLMEWIKRNTAPMASFTGSMQLMAAIKLCTGRPVNNHPHYEDKDLRRKTKQLYQVYGRRTPQDVHAILMALSANYIILEDSICLAPPRNNCRTPDIIDLDNGVIPDGSEPKPGLQRSTVPRFCDEVRHQKNNYAKYFKEVFINKTFRIYQVL
ncbi:protein C-mannosyl-transferase DPY19L3-like [Littorina saxatilis]|uniref:C-mannosyltransferase DPY19L3 n=1 Tax=Littorina saxatilis TaxID=31220 RepID=A0AAN9GHW0_9CAEN